MTAWNFSSSYCVFFDRFQRGNPWWSSQSAKVDSFAAFDDFFFVHNLLEKSWNHRFNKGIEIVIEKIKNKCAIFYFKEKKWWDSMEFQLILLCISWQIPEGQSLMKLPKPKLTLLLLFIIFFVKTVYNSLEKPWNHRFNKEIETVIGKIRKMCHVGILAHPTVHFLMTFST